MITKVKFSFICLINSALSTCSFSKMNQPRKNFILYTLYLFASIKGRINFLQLGRFGKYCEQYFRIGFQWKFDFLSFNTQLLQGRVSHDKAIAFDPSYLFKSGKCTPGVGRFWSGCAAKAKWGLEIAGFAVVDTIANTAYHLKAFQSPPPNELKSENTNLLAHYGGLVLNNAKQWLSFSKYLLADAYFSKKPFIDNVLEAGMHLVSRLRDDAHLQYLYTGAQKTGKGRHKKYAGKMNAKSPDMDYFVLEEDSAQMKVLSAVVYARAFKRNIKVALVIYYDKQDRETARKIYFSTDTEMEALKLVKYYRSRFQIEFLYRDAKQYAGLEHCQARSKEKLDFHFNAALTSVNLAKIYHQINQDTNKGDFSMANFKNLFHKILMLDLFISTFGINPNTTKNQTKIKEILQFGKIAA